MRHCVYADQVYFYSSHVTFRMNTICWLNISLDITLKTYKPLICRNLNHEQLPQESGQDKPNKLQYFPLLFATWFLLKVSQSQPTRFWFHSKLYLKLTSSWQPGHALQAIGQLEMMSLLGQYFSLLPTLFILFFVIHLQSTILAAKSSDHVKSLLFEQGVGGGVGKGIGGGGGTGGGGGLLPHHVGRVSALWLLQTTLLIQVN